MVSVQTKPFVLQSGLHTWRDLVAVADGAEVSVAPDVIETIARYRRGVEAIIARGDRAYGITTGLGALSDVLLGDEDIVALSANTVRSHSCGVGDPLPLRAAKAVMAGQIFQFRSGHAGVSPALFARLVDHLNFGIVPVIPSQGSVGWIVHSAPVGLSLIGEGEVFHQGRRKPASAALHAHGLQPLALGAKEGLSLVNGSPCLTGLSCLAVEAATRLADWADVIAAMSFESLGGQIAAFDPAAMAAKRHASVAKVAERLRDLLRGSQIVARNKGRRTQDALSLRSIPQIHGGIRDTIAAAEARVNDELNASTDNPLVFLDEAEPRIVSQANPHAEGLSLAMDALGMAVAELAGVSERRLARLLNPEVSGLPPFLAAKPGVHSGLMIVQYVSASLVAENRMLAAPSTVDNFVMSGQQEDHVSMGSNAALKALKIAANVQKALAIEYVAAAQAMDFMAGLTPGEGTGAALQHLRQAVPTLEKDRHLAPDLAAAAALLDSPSIR